MFNDVGSIIPRAVSRSGSAHEIENSKVLEVFNVELKKMSEPVQKEIKALYFKDKIITIAAMSFQSAQELKINETEVMENINRVMGKAIVEKIRYII
ncbi:DUF721 domain-containing protein [bacterium]|nr:DUF721 domain-containing protein [bacterium]